MLVGHIRVAADDDKESRPRKLVIKCPTIWLFTARTNEAVAVAGLKPRWQLSQADGYLDRDPELESDSSQSKPVRVPSLAVVTAAEHARSVRSNFDVARPTKLEPARELVRTGGLDWRGLDAVATGFSSRVAEALR